VEPVQLALLVRGAVAARRDRELWQAAVEREKSMRQKLQAFVEQYNSSDDD
jgi:hypothetical protein